jgi:hypothetical protein
MPIPCVVLDVWPWVCCHGISEDRDQCDCGARQAWPRQLEFDYEQDISDPVLTRNKDA